MKNLKILDIATLLACVYSHRNGIPADEDSQDSVAKLAVEMAKKLIDYTPEAEAHK